MIQSLYSAYYNVSKRFTILKVGNNWNKYYKWNITCFKKSNWREANQLAIHKRSRRIYNSGLLWNKSMKCSEWDSNPGPTDSKSNTLTTRPPCLPWTEQIKNSKPKKKTYKRPNKQLIASYKGSRFRMCVALQSGLFFTFSGFWVFKVLAQRSSCAYLRSGHPTAKKFLRF